MGGGGENMYKIDRKREGGNHKRQEEETGSLKTV